MFWNDVGDTRGFTIFDTGNSRTILMLTIHIGCSTTSIYEDTDYQTFDAREYENKIVKVIVRKKSNSKKFEKFIDKLYSANVADLKTVENFEVGDPEEFEAFESEDTLSILNKDISKKQK